LIRPRKMIFIELTVLRNDIDAVLEYLGRRGAIQFPQTEGAADSKSTERIRQILDRLQSASEYLGVSSGASGVEHFGEEEDSVVAGEAEELLAEKVCSVIENFKKREISAVQEKQRLRETITEASAFSKMNVPFSDLEQLSYITLRVGRLDPKGQAALRENMGERALVIPLESGNRVLAASSKKGRFALDSELKKLDFEPIVVPQDYRGVPEEMITSLEEQLAKIEEEIKTLKSEKEALRENSVKDLSRLVSSWNIALIVEGIKSRFTTTESLYHFSGWTPADTASQVTKGLLELTGGRVAIRSYKPDEIPSVIDGSEKVPVSMKHSAFVKGFEGVVFSYGAPLYGTIDPTPLVAVFFTVLFGIMFGDMGQGAVLLLAGILIKNAPKILGKFSGYSTPLVSVGIASIVMGFLSGSVFTNEQLLIPPVRALTGALTGNPVDRILHILPMAAEGGSVKKMMYFFGFTVGIGVVLNSAGLLINIINRCILKKYEAAFFSKTGLAGLLMFWYAVFIVLRIISGGHFVKLDFAGLLIPVFCIFFGPLIWRIIARERPVLQHGLMTFIMEGFVEVLETISSYLSNSVSFLRVGAFALSHAVLSFIVFRFYEQLAVSGIGTLSGVLIMIFGNVIIIVLEGMIVAIQVVRLQYYEFFNKFFVETGVEFAPFRLRSKKAKV